MYEYAWSNKENTYEYTRYCKTNMAQHYSKGKQVTFDLPSDLKELWCDNPAKKASTQGGGQTRWNFNQCEVLAGRSTTCTVSYVVLHNQTGMFKIAYNK